MHDIDVIYWTCFLQELDNSMMHFLLKRRLFHFVKDFVIVPSIAVLYQN